MYEYNSNHLSSMLRRGALHPDINLSGSDLRTLVPCPCVDIRCVCSTLARHAPLFYNVCPGGNLPLLSVRIETLFQQKPARITQIIEYSPSHTRYVSGAHSSLWGYNASTSPQAVCLFNRPEGGDAGYCRRMQRKSETNMPTLRYVVVRPQGTSI